MGTHFVRPAAVRARIAAITSWIAHPCNHPGFSGVSTHRVVSLQELSTSYGSYGSEATTFPLAPKDVFKCAPKLGAFHWVTGLDPSWQTEGVTRRTRTDHSSGSRNLRGPISAPLTSYINNPSKQEKATAAKAVFNLTHLGPLCSFNLPHHAKRPRLRLT